MLGFCSTKEFPLFWMLISGLTPAAPVSPFGLEEAFKEEIGIVGGMKHSGRIKNKLKLCFISYIDYKNICRCYIGILLKREDWKLIDYPTAARTCIFFQIPECFQVFNCVFNCFPHRQWRFENWNLFDFYFNPNVVLQANGGL